MYKYRAHVYVHVHVCVWETQHQIKHEICDIFCFVFFSLPSLEFPTTVFPFMPQTNHIHLSHPFLSSYSPLRHFFKIKFPCPTFSDHSHKLHISRFFFFFLFWPLTEINNGCFSGLQSAGGGVSGPMGGIKYQGKRLGLIREFPLWENVWTQQQGAGRCRSVASDFYLSVKTVICTQISGFRYLCPRPQI